MIDGQRAGDRVIAGEQQHADPVARPRLDHRLRQRDRRAEPIRRAVAGPHRLRDVHQQQHVEAGADAFAGRGDRAPGRPARSRSARTRWPGRRRAASAGARARSSARHRTRSATTPPAAAPAARGAPATAPAARRAAPASPGARSVTSSRSQAGTVMTPSPSAAARHGGRAHRLHDAAGFAERSGVAVRRRHDVAEAHGVHRRQRRAQPGRRAASHRRRCAPDGWRGRATAATRSGRARRGRRRAAGSRRRACRRRALPRGSASAPRRAWPARAGAGGRRRAGGAGASHAATTATSGIEAMPTTSDSMPPISAMRGHGDSRRRLLALDHRPQRHVGRHRRRGDRRRSGRCRPSRPASGRRPRCSRWRSAARAARPCRTRRASRATSVARSSSLLAIGVESIDSTSKSPSRSSRRGCTDSIVAGASTSMVSVSRSPMRARAGSRRNRTLNGAGAAGRGPGRGLRRRPGAAG